MKLGIFALSLLCLAAPAARAQAASHDAPAAQIRVGPVGQRLTGPQAGPVDIITPHIIDSHEIELPIVGAISLPRWKPVRIGSVSIDLSPTKHVVMLMVAAALCMLVLIPAAHAHERMTTERGSPKGFATGIEAVVLYLRNDVILPNVGPHGDVFVPFGLTLFFFILFANLLGLVPYGSTATGNISVTATLALITFVVVEATGIRTQGWRYLRTIFYVPPKEIPLWVKVFMVPIMTVVEIIGKFTKPFALAIRLFANMTAGHVVLLALISLIFTFKTLTVIGASVTMAVGSSLLEIFVAFLQAYIFTILSCVFIGLIRSEAH